MVTNRRDVLEGNDRGYLGGSLYTGEECYLFNSFSASLAFSIIGVIVEP